MRRAFARSDLHQLALDRQSIEHEDPSRRTKRWCWCASCGVVTPRWQMNVDHISPVIPLDRTFEEMSLDEVIDRFWCGIEGLQALCQPCHDLKTAAERKLRPKRPRKPRKAA